MHYCIICKTEKREHIAQSPSPLLSSSLYKGSRGVDFFKIDGKRGGLKIVARKGRGVMQNGRVGVARNGGVVILY